MLQIRVQGQGSNIKFGRDGGEAQIKRLKFRQVPNALNKRNLVSPQEDVRQLRALGEAVVANDGQLVAARVEHLQVRARVDDVAQRCDVVSRDVEAQEAWREVRWQLGQPETDELEQRQVAEEPRSVGFGQKSEGLCTEPVSVVVLAASVMKQIIVRRRAGNVIVILVLIIFIIVRFIFIIVMIMMSSVTAALTSAMRHSDRNV